jgi:hypothetical protein
LFVIYSSIKPSDGGFSVLPFNCGPHRQEKKSQTLINGIG